MKLAGAVLILLAGICAGHCLVAERRARIAALGDFIRSLEWMHGEMQLLATPLPELLTQAAGKSGRVSKALFEAITAKLDHLGEESFSSIWQSELPRCCGMLRQEEQEELASLGMLLGRFSLDEQLLAIEHCVRNLSGKREALERSAPSFRRLALGLCVSSGALLVIILY